jgi:hypothetical protein
MNYIDILIILVLILYATDGWVRGLWDKLSDLVGFLLSFLLALRLYPLVANLFVSHIGLSRHFAKASGFAVIAILGGWGLRKISELVTKGLSSLKLNSAPSAPAQPSSTPLPTSISVSKPLQPLKLLFHLLAAIVAALDGLLFTTLTLAFVITFPLQPQAKEDVFNSQIGNFLVSNIAILENRLTVLLGGAPNETLAFLTLPPNKLTKPPTISLGISIPEAKLSFDPNAEQQLTLLLSSTNPKLSSTSLNQRSSSKPLVDRKNSAVQQLRSLATDMLTSGQLFHPPQTLSSDHHLIALAPSAAVAAQGLLSIPEYHQILISPAASELLVGTVDAGPYGKLFVAKLSTQN